MNILSYEKVVTPYCTNPKMPWFTKTLNETASEDIELIICGSESLKNEDTPVDINVHFFQ